MNRIAKLLLPIGTLMFAMSAAQATERSHTSTVKFVYPLGSGDFVIGLDTDSSQCPNTGTPKYMYVAVGQNGATAEGVSKMYAAALVAFTEGYALNVTFDDGSVYCYINRVTVTN